MLATEFLLWAEVEPNFSRETVKKYGECLKQVWRLVGEKSVLEFSKTDLLRLKSYWLSKSLSASRQMSLLLALKRFLLFCQDEKKLTLCFDPLEIKPPPRPRREVVFLTPEEIESFISTIPLVTYEGGVHHSGLRLRAIVEALLGTAMRISELLSLNRDGIDFERREARIIGKGNKERTVFFLDRSLVWIKRYMDSVLGTKSIARGSTSSGTTNPKYAILGRVVSMIFSGPVLFKHHEWQYQMPLSLSAHP